MNASSESLRRLKIVGVMGSGWEEHADLAEPLGRWLATLPVHLLTGAGAGTMTAVARAFTGVENREGLSIGIVPAASLETPGTPSNGYPNAFIELPIRTPLPAKAPGGQAYATRNTINVLTSDAIVFLPGNKGTRNEMDFAVEFGRPGFALGWPDDGTVPEGIERVATLDALKPRLEAALGL